MWVWNTCTHQWHTRILRMLIAREKAITHQQVCVHHASTHTYVIKNMTIHICIQQCCICRIGSRFKHTIICGLIKRIATTCRASVSRRWHWHDISVQPILEKTRLETVIRIRNGILEVQSTCCFSNEPLQKPAMTIQDSDLHSDRFRVSSFRELAVLHCVAIASFHDSSYHLLKHANASI